MMSERDPGVASAALRGLARYEQAERRQVRPERPEIARRGPATLRDCGGSGPPVVLVPSLINPPEILDLDPQVSLAAAVAALGLQPLLLDWGEASGREDLDIGGHISEILVPLLHELGERPRLIGYCLGGTMAIAAANLAPVERVATIAAPWHFSAYSEEGRAALLRLWNSSKGTADQLGALPMEVLQGAFWSLDPERTVIKFARLAALDPKSAEARRFVVLEDWANEGEALPCPTGRELIEDMFGNDCPGRGEWRVEGRVISDRLQCPALHVTAAQDRITPAAAAPRGDSAEINAGHVGMVVGSARRRLHAALADFLQPSCR